MTMTLARTRAALAAALPLLFAVACSSQSSLSGSLEDDTKPDAGEECTDCAPPDAAPEPKECDAAPDAPPPPVCGDGVCDVGEVCEPDCCDHVCGDGMCGTDEECPADCDGECQEECCGDDCPPPPPPDDETGCTLTQGYWKTHNQYATSPGLILDWPAPYDEDDLMCGDSLLTILQTSPRGDAWIILAHQYIAARLNVASGASTPDEVDTALASAGEWLLANCGGVPASDAPDAIELAETLDRYNHGEIGPGHCD